MTVGSNVLIFTYGINGQPASVNYNGTDYYYVTNAQGDVVSILISSGTAVVTYNYDAWGNILSTTGTMATTLGAHNPLRYRSYVHDEETGLYYLQSRYYNPQICRFISADTFVSTGQGVLGYNMFAYCLNNPINYSDKGGYYADSYSGWIGEEIGKFLYEWITGNDHPNKQVEAIENQIILEQNEMLASTAEYIWDAYTYSLSLEQQSQMLQATAMITAINNGYEFYKSARDSSVVKFGKGALKINKGAKLIKKGLTYIFVPVPTPADDLIGVGYATVGIIYATYGVSEVIICIIWQG